MWLTQIRASGARSNFHSGVPSMIELADRLGTVPGGEQDGKTNLWLLAAVLAHGHRAARNGPEASACCRQNSTPGTGVWAAARSGQRRPAQLTVFSVCGGRVAQRANEGTSAAPKSALPAVPKRAGRRVLPELMAAPVAALGLGGCGTIQGDPVELQFTSLETSAGPPLAWAM